MKQGPYPVATRIKMVREAGQVQRTHTRLHHGSYSNAEHSWHCVMLLLQLHPRPPIQLIEAVLTHDVGERWLGDTPRPTKDGAPIVKAAIDRTEELALKHVGLDASYSLDGEELAWLRAIDSLELLHWCYDQLSLGNQTVSSCVQRLQSWFERKRGELPAPVLNYLASSPFSPWERTPEWLLP